MILYTDRQYKHGLADTLRKSWKSSVLPACQLGDQQKNWNFISVQNMESICMCVTLNFSAFAVI